MNTPSPLVLYVEDERVTREIVRRGLIFSGFTVLEAMTCDDAHGVLNRASPDCILMDLLLPDGDGVDLAHALKARLADEERLPPIIALSSSSIERRRALTSGAFVEVLTKPVAGKHLAEVIRGHIRRMPTNPAMKSQARIALFERVGDALSEIHEKVREIHEILAKLKE